ncbi:M1 family metallopeptidase [Nocardioides sp. URHA0020]|uniref:M1 family metallopeptidase n=1 Tax=Nocardioides sp. URHA0020 TaxID=1380392 RepID=UPI000685E050|nr:M1 family metallopeptidase [Nocardioides sp. URHA0020]
MPRPRLSAATVVAGLALTLTVGLTVGWVGGADAGPAADRTSPSSRPAGSAGIGDPYFPHDGNGGIDVVSYDVHDRYGFQRRRLSGWTELRIRGTAEISRFNLDLLLPVRGVRVDGHAVRFSHRGHELTIRRGLHRGEVVTVLVRYAGEPSRYSYAGESNWLASADEVVSMNQPHMAPWWFPANDHPLDKARIRVSITVPQQYDVVSNGRRLHRKAHGSWATTTWRADEPMVPYLAFFAAGHFQIDHGVSDGRRWLVAVSQALPTATRPEAMRLLRETPIITRWLETQLGDYPFSTVGGLVTSLDAGFALENQTRPTYAPGGVNRTTLVHELAHQWFGDSVAVHHWSDIWLNEGAATFMEWRYDETHGGTTAARMLRESYDGADADDALWDGRVASPCPSHRSCVDRIFADFVYQRGAMTLQALRQRIGGADFARLLRRWLVEREGGNGSTAQFESLAEKVSGEDLGGFFAAWLHSSSKPADTAANGLG